MNFPADPHVIQGMPSAISTQPDLDIYVEDVRTTFNINFNIKGAGIQMAVISPKNA